MIESGNLTDIWVKGGEIPLESPLGESPALRSPKVLVALESPLFFLQRLGVTDVICIPPDTESGCKGPDLYPLRPGLSTN